MFSRCDNLCSIAAPHFLPAECPNEFRLFLASGFAVALDQGFAVPDEYRMKYIKYIRGHKKKLYPLIIKEPALLRLMTSEKTLTNNDIEPLRQRIEAEGNSELMALLLEYQHQNLKPVDIEKKFENEMRQAERQAEREAVLVAAKEMQEKQQQNAIDGVAYDTDVSAELQGKVFIFTGQFSRYGDDEREQIKRMIEARGGRCTTSVSGKTDYVVIGELGEYGMKKIELVYIQRAKGKDIKIIRQSALFNALDGCEY